MLKPSELLISVILGALTLSGCDQQAPARTPAQQPAPPSEPVAQPVPHDLSRSAAALASQVYPQLAAAADVNANLFISPVSLSQGLGLAYLGARGQTREEIAHVLGWPASSDRTALTKAYNTQLTETDDPEIALRVANALWLAKAVPIRAEYVAEARSAFGAAPETVDYRSDPAGAAKRINDWVSGITNGRIAQIVSASAFDAATAALLTNALHFKAKWQMPFADTEKRTFTPANGSPKPIMMMKRIGRFQYRKTPECEAIALPYGHADRFVMEIYLPRDTATLQRWERAMKGTDFFAGRHGGSGRFDLSADKFRELRIVLPRFEARFDKSVKAALIAAGMPSAFSSKRADFSGISSAPLVIDNVAHATFLRIDEEGTEAAAATTMSITVTSMRAPFEGLEMVVDRPFLAALRDRRTGALLFFGRIANPTSE